MHSAFGWCVQNGNYYCVYCRFGNYTVGFLVISGHWSFIAFIYVQICVIFLCAGFKFLHYTSYAWWVHEDETCKSHITLAQLLNFIFALFVQFFCVCLVIEICSTKFFMSCHYFATNFHVLFCTFCLVELVYFSSKAAVSRSCKQFTLILTKIFY